MGKVDLQTLLIAMSVPSGVTAFCFWMIEQKIKKQQKEEDEKEKIREKNETLIIKSVMAAIALGEAVATALKNGHANGETEAALEYARKIKHEQRDFLAEQGIKGIYE
nr:serine/threonine protein kinase [uncultured Acetatifactor sp.]